MLKSQPPEHACATARGRIRCGPQPCPTRLPTPALKAFCRCRVGCERRARVAAICYDGSFFGREPARRRSHTQDPMEIGYRRDLEALLLRVAPRRVLRRPSGALRSRVRVPRGAEDTRGELASIQRARLQASRIVSCRSHAGNVRSALTIVGVRRGKPTGALRAGSTPVTPSPADDRLCGSKTRSACCVSPYRLVRSVEDGMRHSSHTPDRPSPAELSAR